MRDTGCYWLPPACAPLASGSESTTQVPALDRVGIKPKTLSVRWLMLTIEQPVRAIPIVFYWEVKVIWKISAYTHEQPVYN